MNEEDGVLEAPRAQLAGEVGMYGVGTASLRLFRVTMKELEPGQEPQPLPLIPAWSLKKRGFRLVAHGPERERRKLLALPVFLSQVVEIGTVCTGIWLLPGIWRLLDEMRTRLSLTWAIILFKKYRANKPTHNPNPPSQHKQGLHLGAILSSLVSWAFMHACVCVHACVRACVCVL